MTITSANSHSFGLLFVSIVKCLSVRVCASFPFGFGLNIFYCKAPTFRRWFKYTVAFYQILYHIILCTIALQLIRIKYCLNQTFIAKQCWYNHINISDKKKNIGLFSSSPKMPMFMITFIVQEGKMALNPHPLKEMIYHSLRSCLFF